MDIKLHRDGFTVWWGDNHPVWKSISFACNLCWITKPWTWFSCRTNGAVKGKDSCFDFNFHLFLFHFSYTDWSYWRFKDEKRETVERSV